MGLFDGLGEKLRAAASGAFADAKQKLAEKIRDGGSAPRNPDPQRVLDDAGVNAAIQTSNPRKELAVLNSRTGVSDDAIGAGAPSRHVQQDESPWNMKNILLGVVVVGGLVYAVRS